MLFIGVVLVLELGWPWERHAEKDLPSDQPPQGIQQHASKVTASKVMDQGYSLPKEELPIVSLQEGSGHGWQEPALLDINRSSEHELEQLPGIGPVLAKRIIERRAVVGMFQSPKDLKSVKGLGEKRIEKLLPLIRFHEPPKG